MKLQRLLLPILLFSSGLCGISYEILYGRLLANIFGDQFLVSTAILLTFLLGIGFGALYAHRFWRSLWLIEACIGLYAVVFAKNISSVETLLYEIMPSTGTSAIASLSMAALLLFVPAFMIGVSLPLFSGYAHRLRPSVGYFSWSYAVYNIGAALTVLLIEFWLIRQTGIRQAVFYMAALNGFVSLVLLLFFRPVSATKNYSLPVSGAGFSRWVILSLAIASVGSAIFQLTTLRLSEMLLGPYRESFALVLCVILLGIALGSLLVNRYRIGFVPLMVANILALCWVLGGLNWMTSWFALFYPSASSHYWYLVALKFGLVSSVALLPAITFGATVPALLHSQAGATVRQGSNTARSPGYLLFVSAVANAGGFLLMSLVLHKSMDYGDILLVVIMMSAVSLSIIYFGTGQAQGVGKTFPGFRYGAIFVCLVLLVSVSRINWNEELLYQGHYSFKSITKLKSRIGDHATSERYKGEQDVLSISKRNGKSYLFINGKVSINLNDPSEKIVGAISAVFSKDHHSAMVLGVGSGATAGAVGLLFDKVDAVEISGVILDNLFRMDKYNFGLAEMPNVRLTHDDAIHALKMSSGQYSLILNTVTSPLFFSSSKLYTVDFLREVRSKLAPGGLYITWLDSRVGDKGADIMMASVTGAFKHCGLAQMGASYLLLMCSDSPIQARHPGVVSQQDQIANYLLTEHKVDPKGIAYQLLSADAAQLIVGRDVPINTLDYPVLEFEMARVLNRGIPDLQDRIVKALDLSQLGSAFSHFDWRLESLLDATEKVTGRNIYYEALSERHSEYKSHHRNAVRAQQAGDCEAAVVFINQALEMEGRVGNSGLRLGRCYEMVGMHAQALARYREEMERNPDNGQIRLLLGRVLIWMENFDMALEELLLVPTRDRNGAYYYLLATVTEKLGDKPAAKDYYDRAAALDGSIGAAVSSALGLSGEPQGKAGSSIQ